MNLALLLSFAFMFSAGLFVGWALFTPRRNLPPTPLRVALCSFLMRRHRLEVSEDLSALESLNRDLHRQLHGTFSEKQ